MSTFDISALLSDRDPISPSGPNLEYDPQFVELEVISQGKPETQYGDTITPAVPPDWKRVRKQSLELLERSHDLRLAVLLLRANLNLYAAVGLADGLQLVEKLLTERWESVHPQLDPEDDMDPTLRINSLAVLAENTLILQDLKNVALVNLPAFGPLTIRLLDVASGESSRAEGEEEITLSSLSAALTDVDQTLLRETTEALHQAFASADVIEKVLVTQVGNVQALNLTPLLRTVKRAAEFFAPHGLPAAGESRNETATEGSGEPGATKARPVQAMDSNEIANREDVLRMLDKILKYYQQFEPSSPVPLLLGRARSLVSKNFMEIMEDLAPDGVSQVMLFRGNRDNA